MATSPHLSHKLREALGPEAGDELIGVVNKAASDISDLRGDLAELRHQVELGFARIDTRFAEMERTFDARLAETDKTVRLGFAAADTRLERQTSRLVLWSFAFWVTTLAAMAGLLVTLR